MYYNHFLSFWVKLQKYPLGLGATDSLVLNFVLLTHKHPIMAKLIIQTLMAVTCGVVTSFHQLCLIENTRD